MLYNQTILRRKICYENEKIISVLTVTAMSVSLLAGCGGSGDTTTASEEAAPAEETQTEETGSEEAVEEQVLKVAAFEGGYGADMWSEVVAAFEASHPGVTVELTVDKKIEDVISPSMKAGDYPDVVHLVNGKFYGNAGVGSLKSCNHF